MGPWTRNRCFGIQNCLRHDILELTFGYATGDRAGAIQDLFMRLQTAKQAIPEIFRTPINRSAFDILTKDEISSACCDQLQHLQSLFLLWRIEKTDENEIRSLEVAQKLLSLVITCWNMRDGMPGHLDEIVWNVSQ